MFTTDGLVYLSFAIILINPAASSRQFYLLRQLFKKIYINADRLSRLLTPLMVYIYMHIEKKFL